MKHIPLFDELAALFAEKGFRLYMIGGASRDYLLDMPINDFDFVSDATPDDMKQILPEADYTFSKYGSVHFMEAGINVDITTLRIEGKYLDMRHPSFIKYVKDIKQDYVRRDFTINAIYIDTYYKIHDFCSGINDLNNHIIRFIGDPIIRVQEDPLRILRAERFAKRYDFTIERDTSNAMEKYRYLIDKLQKCKVNEENNKN
jgi:tRNA nucleotidyltransferase (CCA-adding enzyme)